MLQPVFSQSAGGDPFTGEPLAELRFEGPALLNAPGGREIARHGNHFWEFESTHTRYFRLDCGGPLLVTFEDEQGQPVVTLGPYEHFSTADGIAYANRLHFASYAENTGMWFCREAGGSWRVMVVRPAERPKA